MKYNIIIEDKAYNSLKTTVRKILDKTVSHLRLGEGEIGLLLTDNNGIIPYNEKYTGRKGETDVLAFVFDGENPEGGKYLGDIVISHERARSQADEFGHSFEDELCKLTVHGFLHLLGYDHKDGDETMEKIEKELTGV